MLVKQNDVYMGALLTATVNRTQCTNRGSHSGIFKDSGLLGCDGVFLGEWLSAFRKTIAPSSSMVKQSKENSQISPIGYSFWTTSPLKMKALCCFEISGVIYPLTQSHFKRPDTYLYTD